MQRERGERKSTGVLEHLLKGVGGDGGEGLHMLLLSQLGQGCQFFDSSVAVSNLNLLSVSL